MENLPFEIPDSWAWVRVQNYTLTVFNGKPPKYSKVPTAHKVIGQQANQWDGVNLEYVKYCTEEFAQNMPKMFYLQDGDVLLNSLGNGTLGRSSCFDMDVCNETLLTDGHLFVFRNYSKQMSKFLQYYLQVKCDDIINTATGSTNQTFLSLNNTLQWIIPTPPLAEQERIISYVNSLFDRINIIDNNQAELEQLYDDLKKKTLDLAIQGKLVSQDPNDEPACELLKRIRTEKKAQLGKKYVDSYIYKGDDNCYYEKIGNNELILLENLPFEIPDSWVWSRLDNAVLINPRQDIDDNLEVAFVEMKSLQEGFQNSFVYESRSWKSVKSGFTHFQDNDVGFAKITPCFQNRKSCVFQNLKNGYGAGTTELHILRTYLNTILPDYLLWFTKAPYFIEYGKQNFSGTAGQQRFGTNEVKKMLLPIPPLNEQLRIIKFIQQIFKIIKKDES